MYVKIIWFNNKKEKKNTLNYTENRTPLYGLLKHVYYKCMENSLRQEYSF